MKTKQVRKKSLLVIALALLWILAPLPKAFLQDEQPDEAAITTQEICYNAPVPPGWILVNSYAQSFRCGFTANTTNYPNVHVIEYIEPYFVGTIIQVCNSAPVPTGWTVIDYHQWNNRCGVIVNNPPVTNVKSIKRLNGPTPTPTPNTPTPAPTTRSPIGYLDSIDSNTRKAKGWSLDPDNPSVSNQVHIYIDGAFVTVLTASEPRIDVNQNTGYPGNHGFTFAIPSQYFDNNTHTMNVYGIDTGANPPAQLTGSPKTFTFGPPPARTAFDYNGDGKADETVFRTGNWYSNLSPNNGFGAWLWGQSGDTPVPADYDGDGKTDLAVFRPSGGNRFWYILRSSDGQMQGLQFGMAVDKPVPADYDGDTKADVAVFRPDNGIGYWYLLNSSTQQMTGAQFGVATDKPVPGDYDGDGRADIAVTRASDRLYWFAQRTSLGFNAVQFGNATDKPAPADYDGDGKTDIAVYRDGEWYVQRSRDGFFGIAFGSPGDTPVPADYDGDGKADFALYHTANGYAFWNILRSSDGQSSSIQFGLASDIPAVGVFPQ